MEREKLTRREKAGRGATETRFRVDGGKKAEMGGCGGG
jgi:hypothetical protein